MISFRNQTGGNLDICDKIRSRILTESMNKNGRERSKHNAIVDSEGERDEDRRVGVVLCEIERAVGDDVFDFVLTSCVIEDHVGGNREVRRIPDIGEIANRRDNPENDDKGNPGIQLRPPLGKR